MFILPGLDPRVLSLLIATNAVAIALAIFISARNYPSSINRALNLFGLAKVIASTGFVLVALRGMVSVEWSVAAANVVLITGLYVNLVAVRVLMGRSPQVLMGVLGAAIAGLGAWYFGVLHGDLRGVRVISSAVAMVILGEMSLELLVRCRVPGNAHYLAGLVALLAFVVCGWRMVSMMLDPNVVGLGDPIGWAERVFYLTLYMGSTIGAVNFVLISSDVFNADLKNMAQTDSLTGLPNRRTLNERGGLEIRRARRLATPLSVLLLDIDRFKVINDSWGHAIGDQVICAMADHLRAMLRDVDCAGRLGGEEFVVVLPETNQDTAMIIAERLRLAVERAELQVGDVSPLKFTISIGVAGWSEDKDFDDLVALADHAMYRAKHSGRNRVTGITALREEFMAGFAANGGAAIATAQDIP